MAQNITLMGASYSAVPAVTLPKTGGGTARFDDTTDADATAADIVQGKTAYVNGVKLTGTGSGGGGVTVTDEPNATGITCVITTGSQPSPDIPLNTQLIDFTKITNGYVVDENTGELVVSEWSSCSDFTLVDPSMTFSYVGYRWYNIIFFTESKQYIGKLYMDNDADSYVGDYAHGTLNTSKIPSTAKYVRIDTYPTNPGTTELSLIRTA